MNKLKLTLTLRQYHGHDLTAKVYGYINHPMNREFIIAWIKEDPRGAECLANLGNSEPDGGSLPGNSSGSGIEDTQPRFSPENANWFDAMMYAGAYSDSIMPTGSKSDTIRPSDDESNPIMPSGSESNPIELFDDDEPGPIRLTGDETNSQQDSETQPPAGWGGRHYHHFNSPATQPFVDL